MKTALLVPLFLATLGTLPPGPPAEKVDVSGKPYIELVGAGPAKIGIRSEESEAFLGVHVTYPKSGAEISTSFKDGAILGFAIVRRIGDTKVCLYDNDGDGLPDVRHSFRVLPSGEEQLLRIERLQWSSTVSP